MLSVSKFYCKLSVFLNALAAGIKGVDKYLPFDVKVKETVERCDQSVFQSVFLCHSSDFYLREPDLRGLEFLLGIKYSCYIIE